MLTSIWTDVELAEHLGLDLKELHRLRRQDSWPCHKFGRTTWRFTEDDVAQILARYAAGTETTAPKSKQAPVGVIKGQTARSAARRRAA